MNDQWFRDPRVENLLKDLGIDFEIRRGVALRDLRLEESKNANARYTDQTFADNVILYTTYMKDGHPFPMPVITTDNMIQAGCNRLEAAGGANLDTVDVYVIKDYTPESLEEFRRLDNTQHGRALTEDEKIAWIVSHHRTTHEPLYNLNRRFFGDNKRTYDKLKHHVAAADTADSLAGIGVDPTKIDKNQRVALHPIRARGPVLRDLFEITFEFDVSTTELEKVVQSIKDHEPTEADEIIKSFRTERVRNRDVGGLTPASNLKRHLNAICNFLKEGNSGQPYAHISQITFQDAKQQESILGLIIELQERLQAFKSRKRGK